MLRIAAGSAAMEQRLEGAAVETTTVLRIAANAGAVESRACGLHGQQSLAAMVVSRLCPESAACAERLQ